MPCPMGLLKLLVSRLRGRRTNHYSTHDTFPRTLLINRLHRAKRDPPRTEKLAGPRVAAARSVAANSRAPSCNIRTELSGRDRDEPTFRLPAAQSQKSGGDAASTNAECRSDGLVALRCSTRTQSAVDAASTMARPNPVPPLRVADRPRAAVWEEGLLPPRGGANTRDARSASLLFRATRAIARACGSWTVYSATHAATLAVPASR